MMLATETDLFGLDFYKAFQPDTDRIRTWQMAGTAHADQSTLDYGITSGRQWDKTSKVPDFTKLCGSVNDGPQSYIVRAAFAALNTWVVDGTQPPHSPAIKVTDGTAIARDADGNALGGIRMPAVAVPTKTLSGDYEPGKSVICSLFGSQAPFSAAKLKQLYPTHADYVAKVKASAAAAEKAGFLLPPDAQEIEQQAEAAPVPERGDERRGRRARRLDGACALAEARAAIASRRRAGRRDRRAPADGRGRRARAQRARTAAAIRPRTPRCSRCGPRRAGGRHVAARRRTCSS